MGGTGRGVLQCRGRYTDLRPLTRAREESCALWAVREGKWGWRPAVAGFTSSGEQLMLSAASRCRWEIRRGTWGRQDSTEKIAVGVAEKQFVVYLWTVCQKVLRGAMAPALGMKRSTPYTRMGATRDAASLWHRYGGRPALGGQRCLMRVKAPWGRASRCGKWAEESRAGVNQYLSHCTRSQGRNSSPFI